MDNPRPLQSVDPRPISSPYNPNSMNEPNDPSSYPNNPYPYQPMPGTLPSDQHDSLPHHPAPPNNGSFPPPPPGPNPSIGLHMGPESQIPDHPGSTYEIPRPPAQTFASQQQLVTDASQPRDLRSIRSSCMYGLREYMSIQNKRKRPDASVVTLEQESQMRGQADVVLGDLRTLQAELRALARQSEEHRWRRWIVGGAIASFIPLVRRIFRRGKDEESQLSANDTEYAWRRAHSLLARIKDSVFGSGGLASMAFFVFAVLYVFKNEVTLRVARTLQKRIRKLYQRIERGDQEIDEADLKMFDGWRWRIVL